MFIGNSLLAIGYSALRCQRYSFTKLFIKDQPNAPINICLAQDSEPPPEATAPSKDPAAASFSAKARAISKLLVEAFPW